MRKVFNSQFKITQEFGVNKDYYQQFGLAGHEGKDLIPTGTVWDIYCLEDGVVVKDIDDAVLGKNYGKNVTIWHPTIRKATQYCHLASNNVQMGQRVSREEKIGVMGSTGNTTGAHLHLNLFDVDENGVRLNRDNGFFGGINPLSFLQEDISVPVDTITIPKSQFEDFERVKIGWNKLREKLNVEDNVTVVVGEVDKLIGYQDSLIQKDKQLTEATDEMNDLEIKLRDLNDTNTILIEENKNMEIEVKKQGDTIEKQEVDILSLKDNIEKLKQDVTTPILTGWKRLIFKILEKL